MVSSIQNTKLNLEQIRETLSNNDNAYTITESKIIKNRSKENIKNLVKEVGKHLNNKTTCTICEEGDVTNITPTVIHECNNIIVYHYIGVCSKCRAKVTVGIEAYGNCKNKDETHESCKKDGSYVSCMYARGLLKYGVITKVS